MRMIFRSNHLLYCFGFALVIIALTTYITSVESKIISYGNSIDNRTFCQLRLYQIQSFQGNPDKFNRNRRRRFRRGHDKSVQTISKAIDK